MTTATTSTAPSCKASQVIPISTETLSSAPPPEWALLELNGELICPTQFPSKSSCEEVLGADGRVELGRLKLGPDNVSN